MQIRIVKSYVVLSEGLSSQSSLWASTPSLSAVCAAGVVCCQDKKPRDGERWEVFMKLVRTAVISAALAFSAGVVNAQQVDYSKVQIKTTDLGHGTYMLEGQGGNITVAVGGDGVIMVDSEFAPLHDKIKAAIAAVSDKSVRYLINTHFHRDHTGGNAGFAKDGAVVVAHVNVRKRLAEGSVNGLTGAKTPPQAGGALPSKTYKSSMTVRIENRSAKLTHFPNAHTDGDTYVYFADANVLATGDIVTLGRYPNIDFANGGNIKGMIAGVDAYLKLVNAKTKIVPGHGPLADRATLVEYRKMLVAARDRVARLIAKGMSEDEVVAMRPMSDYDAKLKVDDRAKINFIRVVYNSLKPPKAG
jgi:glyoxylase-like metal-dependent hydrolase (beta-lactamase superfamily II)